MIITVDCNSDRVKIENRNQIVSLKISYPHQVIEILSQIFNLMDVVNYNVQLVKIDEDNRTTVDEW